MNQLVSTKHWLYDNLTYLTPNMIFTPEDIKHAGFIFVSQPSFVCRFDDPENPIMNNYAINGSDVERQVSVRTSFIREIKIKGLNDFFLKRNELRPKIVEQIKLQEFYYVYSVEMLDSPCIATDVDYFYPIVVRGCKLPKNVIDKIS